MRISAKTWMPLLGAAVAAFCLTPSARAVTADPRTPADAEVVVSINVHQILDSELFKKYAKDELDKALLEPTVKKELAAIGWDPRRTSTSCWLPTPARRSPGC